MAFLQIRHLNTNEQILEFENWNCRPGKNEGEKRSYSFVYFIPNNIYIVADEGTKIIIILY